MKASAYLTNGTMIEVEGTNDEVSKVLNTISEMHLSAPTNDTPPKDLKLKVTGPTGYLLEMRDEGFFTQRRTLSETVGKLEEMGHIYSTNMIAPILYRLVASKRLRRVKDAHGWSYVWDSSTVR